jgi:photosystem II stability/assembly factor-like uncharacterized protein
MNWLSLVEKGEETLERYLLLAILAVLGSKASAQWSPTSKPEGGIVQALCATGGSLFAGTRGGLYASTNNGTSWKKVTTPMETHGVYSLLVNGATLFVGTGDNPAVSSDGGNTWTVIENGLPGFSGIMSLAQIGTHLFAGTYIGRGVYVSTNSGGNWSQVNAGLPNKPVLSLAGIGANVYAGTDGAGVFLSTNEGMSWTSVGLANDTVYTLLASGASLFAGTGGGVFLSTDNGANWTAGGLAGYTVHTLLAGGTNLFAGTSGGVFLSTDNGAGWTTVGLTDYMVYTLLAGGTNLFAGTGGGVFLSTDDGASWKAVSTGLTRTWIQAWAIDACDSNMAVISVYPPQTFQTSDGGNTWREMAVAAPAEEPIDLSMVDNSHIWLCTDQGRIYRTTDGGVSWAVQFYDTSKTDFFNYIKMFDLNSGVAEGDGPPTAPAFVLKTTDGGDHWTEVPNTLEGTSGSTWRRISFVNPNVGYFFVSGYGPQGLFKTTDGGVSWSQTSYPGYAWVIKFYDHDLGLAISLNHLGYRTTDGGSTWLSFASPHAEYGSDIEFVPGNPSEVWMTDNSGLYFSRDTGRTWNEQPSVSGGRDIIFVNDKCGWLLGDDGVLYRTTTGGLVGVVDRGAPTRPETFSLRQNYPNPFNPTTTIEFSLSHSGYVTLKVFNLLGAEVATVLARNLTAGSHSVGWNAANFPSGVYFYRLQTGEFLQTKKLLVLR